MRDKLKEPLTRESFIKLIEENKGETRGLDLSKVEFVEEIDLRGINNNQLFGIILNEAVLEKAHLEGLLLSGAQLEGAFLDEAHLEGARLSGANLKNANLPSANLKNTRLNGAHLENTELFGANLQNAELVNAFLYKTRLSFANLQGCDINGAKFDNTTQIEKANWGNFKVADEIDGELNWAKDTYRQLKQWYNNAGLYDTGAEFYYREMECKRKSLKWFGKSSFFEKTKLELSRILFGYGEKWERLIIWIIFSVSFFAIIYYILGLVSPQFRFTESNNNLLDSFYYSAATFSSLGYVGKGPEPASLIKCFGIFESFFGLFMAALLVTTFTRKWIR